MSAHARILTVLKQQAADAANPLAAGDLVALVGGPERDTWAELEGLVRDHQVMTCHIHREAGSVVVFWPMGKIVTERSRAIARTAKIKAKGRARK